MPSQNDAWPELPYEAWKDTCATLQLWTQIVGKIRLVQTPWLNHSWHVVLYVTPRGLTTSAIPYGDRSFELDFDFLDHVLRISTSDGGKQARRALPPDRGRFLRRTSCARLLSWASTSASMSFPTRSPTRSGSARIRFTPPTTANSRKRSGAFCFSRARVLERFRTSFIGKCSPVHFFWGSFDLAVTRFSGRRAPKFSGAGSVPNMPEAVVLDAYSHEVSSAGFWPGGRGDRLPRLLLLCVAVAAGIRRGEGASGGSVLEPGISTNSSCPTMRCAPPSDPEGALMDFLDQHLRGGCLARQMGSRRPGMPSWRARRAAQGRVGLMRRADVRAAAGAG